MCLQGVGWDGVGWVGGWVGYPLPLNRRPAAAAYGPATPMAGQPPSCAGQSTGFAQRTGKTTPPRRSDASGLACKVFEWFHGGVLIPAIDCEWIETQPMHLPTTPCDGHAAHAQPGKCPRRSPAQHSPRGRSNAPSPHRSNAPRAAGQTPPPSPVKHVEVRVLERLAHLHHAVGAEVEEHHGVAVVDDADLERGGRGSVSGGGLFSRPPVNYSATIKHLHALRPKAPTGFDQSSQGLRVACTAGVGPARPRPRWPGSPFPAAVA